MEKGGLNGMKGKEKQTFHLPTPRGVENQSPGLARLAAYPG